MSLGMTLVVMTEISGSVRTASVVSAPSRDTAEPVPVLILRSAAHVSSAARMCVGVDPLASSWAMRSTSGSRFAPTAAPLTRPGVLKMLSGGVTAGEVGATW